MATKATVARWQAVGSPVALPAVLDNGILRLEFSAHTEHGVTLSRIVHLEDRQLSRGSFAWRNAQTSTDRVVTGALWSLRAQPRSGFRRSEFSAAFGGGFVDVLPTPTVLCTSTTDRAGRPALMFRWRGVPWPGGSTTRTVVALVALGAGEKLSRWTIHVQAADGDGTAAIERVEFPRLAIAGPVADYGPGQRACQVGAQVLVPASSTPPLGFENMPLASWEGQELETSHPTGEEGAHVQPLQFDALAAVDRRDPASLGRVLVLASDDRAGTQKRVVRSGSMGELGLALRWSHRWYPRWGRTPITGPAATDRYGGDFTSPYAVQIGCLEAPEPASWWHRAAAFYRDEIIRKQLPCVPKGVDPHRSILARGAPWIGAVEQSPAMTGEAAGTLFTSWADEHREAIRAPAIIGQLNALAPEPQEPKYDFSKMRGTNWLVSGPMSDCLHKSLLSVTPGLSQPATGSGNFYLPHIQRELDLIRAKPGARLPGKIFDVGYNCMRVWGSFAAWCCDRGDYLRNLQTLCDEFRARGLGMTYVVFNAVPAGYGVVTSARFLLEFSNWDPAALRSTIWNVCDIWQTDFFHGAPHGVPARSRDMTHVPEPCSGAEWKQQGEFGRWSDVRTQALVVQYMQDVAQLFAANEDVFLSYDLYNECNIMFRTEGVKDLVLDFLAKAGAAMRTYHRAAQFTVGWGGDGRGYGPALEAMGLRLAYYSWHMYVRGDANLFSAAYGQALAAEAAAVSSTQALSVAKPVVMSECYILPYDSGLLRGYFDVMRQVGAGGQMWTYCKTNSWQPEVSLGSGALPFDGIVECTTPCLDITTGQRGRAWGRAWSRDFGGPALGFALRQAADLDAIREWVNT